MPTEPLRGYPYPAPTDNDDVPYDLQRLAEAIGVDVKAVWDAISTEAATVAPGTGWGAVSGYPIVAFRVGRLVVVHGAVSFSTAALNATMATLPTAFRPPTNRWLGSGNTSGGGAVRYQLLVADTGAISIPSGYSSGAAASGNVFPIHGTYRLGD